MAVLVNDIHAKLNETLVKQITVVRSIADIQCAVKQSTALNLPVSIAGGRHAMGGQQFKADAILLDTTCFNKVLRFDCEARLVEVEAGIQWPALIDYLHQAQIDQSEVLTIPQKQTGADRLSIGGCLSANIHGRGLTMQPFISNVEAFTLVDANGELQYCSRTQQPELFRLVIGGYGLFGVIATVTLRLVPRQQTQRIVEVIQIEDLMPAFEQRIKAGYLYGDFQFAIDPRSDDFLNKGVFACYRPVANTLPILEEQQKSLSEADWLRLISLAHTDKTAAFQAYADYYLSTSGQYYWSDTQQLTTYLDDYHHQIDPILGHQGSEIITEVYVPRDQLVTFMQVVAADFRQHQVDLIYGTIRLIEQDTESFMPWAKQSYACIIFNLHIHHTAIGQEQAAQIFRRLIDLAIEYNGNYYLTYHRFATKWQVERCYPQFRQFLQLKQQYDPDGRFQSDWYQHYQRFFAEEAL